MSHVFWPFFSYLVEGFLFSDMFSVTEVWLHSERLGKSYECSHTIVFFDPVCSFEFRFRTFTHFYHNDSVSCFKRSRCGLISGPGLESFVSCLPVSLSCIFQLLLCSGRPFWAYYLKELHLYKKLPISSSESVFCLEHIMTKANRDRLDEIWLYVSQLSYPPHKSWNLCLWLHSKCAELPEYIWHPKHLFNQIRMYQPTLDIILYILVAKNMKKQTKVKQGIIIIWDFQAFFSAVWKFQLILSDMWLFIIHSLRVRQGRDFIVRKMMRSPQNMEFHGALKKVYDCVKQYQGMRLWDWGMAVQFRVLIVST